MVKVNQILFYILVLLPVILISPALGKTFNYPKDEFSITLPDEWVEIPYNIIEDFMVKESKILQKKKNHYDYGYQLKSNGWFHPPYILIL